MSTVCQYLTLYRLLVLYHCVHCSLLETVQILSLPHTMPSLGSVSLWPLLSSRFCPLSDTNSQRTISLFCDTKSTAVFYSLLNTCQYLTMYNLSTFSQYLTMNHFLFCVILYTDTSYSFPKSVSTSHSTACLFRATGSTAVFYSMLSVCQYLTDYHFLVVSQCPLLSSMVCPMFVRTSHSKVPWFCVIVPTAVQYQLVYHNLLSVVAESVRPLLSSLDCLMSVSMSHLTVRWFCVTKSTAFI